MTDILPDYSKLLEENIFPKILKRNVILFLGAGASVTDRYQFLSKHIIKEYSQHQGIDFSTNDIVEFVDVISENEQYSRRDFDDFVQRMLEKLEPTETHKIIAGLAWREIITTNLDLTLERAFDRIRNTSLENCRLKPILKVKDEGYVPSNDEVRYVKLHGCISSREKYPFVFSSADFERSKVFYKKILSRLTFLSNDIEFLAIGYSFSDDFAKRLLDNFDKYARAGRRPLFLVDPFIQDAQIPLLKSKGIQVIKLNADQFFQKFQQWQKEQDEETIKRKGIIFSDVKKKKIDPPAYLLRSLGDDLKPLDIKNTKFASPEGFYRGEEPTFDVIRQNLDVIRTDLLNDSLQKLEKIITDSKESVPIILFKGSFGIGKSTFLYRLISEVFAKESLEAIAFEVGDSRKLNIQTLEELFNQTRAKTIFLILEKIETSSSYREFRQFQAKLSVSQFTQFKVVLISSIRENILEKFKLNSALQDSYEINLDQAFTELEAENLIRKLEDHKLLICRDSYERSEVVQKVLKEYEGDLLVTLHSLLSESHHERILQDAFNQLTEVAQNALLFISLLYQHQIMMPSGILRVLLGYDVNDEWMKFGEQILNVDFKGFVRKEVLAFSGTEPDVYLRIRHRRIAENIVKLYYPSEDNIFDAYKELINKLEVNSISSTLITDILKATRQQKELSQSKIDKLFDVASLKFDIDPHFVLHYSMNLERRGTRKDLEKGIEQIIIVTSELDDLKNDRLIHRRAVLNASLGKLIYRESTEAHQAIRYFNQARSFFQRKRILDPQSHYSYENYLQFEIWYLDNLIHPPDEELKIRIQIEELFEQAENLVSSNLNRIQEIKIRYHRDLYGKRKNDYAYLNLLGERCQDKYQKPFALVLKYYYFLDNNEEWRCNELIPELEALTEYDSVVSVLFRHYGKYLYNPNIRQKFLEFIRKNEFLEKQQPIRFHFFQAITQAYNKRFGDAFEHIKYLRENFHHFNSDLVEIWGDTQTGKPKSFEAIAEKKKGRYYAHIIELQQNFPLYRSILKQNLKHNDHCIVELHFYPYAIKAVLKEVVKSVE